MFITKKCPLSFCKLHLYFIQNAVNDDARLWMHSTPIFTMVIYLPKLASKLKRIHHSSISHRVKMFVNKTCIIVLLQSKHSLRSYRNARNLLPLFQRRNVYIVDCSCPHTDEIFSKQQSIPVIHCLRISKNVFDCSNEFLEEFYQKCTEDCNFSGEKLNKYIWRRNETHLRHETVSTRSLIIPKIYVWIIIRH